MFRTLLIAELVAAPAVAADRPSPQWPAPANRGDRLMRDVVIGAHNVARRDFGVAPLVWNDELASGAMIHARRMAETGVYAHDQTPGRRKKAGENMWRGKRGVYSYDFMVGMMIDERKLFRAGAFPDNATNGDWHAVAHYTQIVWPTTTEVGCAVASSATMDYLVCRYAPTGNKEGFMLTAGTAPVAGLALAEGGR